MSQNLYLGLMSGTSMDAVDCALVEMQRGLPRVLAQHACPLPGALRQDLQRLCANREVDLQFLGSMDIQIGKLFADTVNSFLEAQGLQATDIQAIGSHGQTVWHEPPTTSGKPAFSLQIGDPNTIAECTGITTVADFRRRDMAAGGQGAPVVPVLHQALFQSSSVDRIVLNLGGIANITLLRKDGSAPLGMDTGPASILMDAWIKQHHNSDFDEAGAWAASAKADPALLELLLDEPFFTRSAPKSTGRELFNQNWLHGKLKQLPDSLEAATVQASLLALTVETVAREVQGLLASGEILVCGGGARNAALMSQLALRLPGFKVQSTTAHGLDADYVEATAFAWFAYRTLQRQPIAFHPFTGARHAVIAGGVYYA